MAGKGNPNWIKGGPSPNPTGTARTSRTDDRASGSVNPMARLAAHISSRMDGYSNSTTGLGVRGRDKTIGSHFHPDVIDGYTAERIYRGDPIARRLVELIPNDATSEEPQLLIGDVDTTANYYKPEQPDPVRALPSPPQLLPGKPLSKTDAAFGAVRALNSWERRVVQAVGRQRRDAAASSSKSLTEEIAHSLGRNHLNAMGAINQAMKWRNAYGGSAILIGARDHTTDMRQPLDLKRVRSLDYITVLEARELLPIYYYNDPFSAEGTFGKPAIYQLVPFQSGASVNPNIPARTSQIHESRLIVFDGPRVSRRDLWGASPGWGDSIFTWIGSALKSFAQSIQNIDVLLSSFAQAIYKIKGLASALLKNPDALTDAMLGVELCRSICNAVIIDEGEEFKRESVSLAGYAEMIDRLALNITVASGIPHTRLFGTSAKGLNATGEGDDRSYFGGVSREQTHEVGPAYLKLVRIEMAARGEDPENVTHSVAFKPLWQPTELEIAQTRKTVADTDKIYIEAQVVSPEEVALNRFGGDTWSMETHLDMEARAKELAVVPPPVDAAPEPEQLPPGIGPDGEPEDGEGVDGEPDEDPNDFADQIAEHADHSDPFAEHSDAWTWVVGGEHNDAFNPNQARGPDGKWIKGGGSGAKKGHTGAGGAAAGASGAAAGGGKAAKGQKAVKPKSATALQKEAHVSSRSKAGQAIKEHVKAGNHEKAQALVESIKTEKAARAEKKATAEKANGEKQAHAEKAAQAEKAAADKQAHAEKEAADKQAAEKQAAETLKAQHEAEKAKHEADKAKSEADIARAEAYSKRQEQVLEERRQFQELIARNKAAAEVRRQQSAVIADGIAHDGSSITPAAAKALRDEARTVLAKYGLTPHSDRGLAENGGTIVLGQLKTGYMAMDAVGPAANTMHAGTDAMKEIKAWHDNIKAGRSVDPRRNFSRLGTIHEHIHSSGPSVPYRGKGMLHEEMVTEMSARHVVAEEHNTSPAALRAGETGYSNHMDALTSHLAEGSGADFHDAHNALASASLDFKSNKLGTHHSDPDAAFHVVARQALSKLGVEDTGGKSEAIAKRWADYAENDFKYGG